MPQEQPRAPEERGRCVAEAEGQLQAGRCATGDTQADANRGLTADRAATETRARHIGQILTGIRRVNQLIIAEEDPLRLIQRACATLTENMGYLNAWIALCDPASGGVTATASSGPDTRFDALLSQLRTGRHTSCMRQALAQAAAVVVHKPTAECSSCPLNAAYADRSGLCCRLNHGDTVFGTLSASVPAAYADDTEELALFSELAGDIGFALHKIAAAKQLRQSHRDLQRAQAIAQMGSWRFNLKSGTLTASDAARRIYGLGTDEWSVARVQTVPLPQYRSALDHLLQRLITEGEPYDIEFEICRPSDHAIRHIHSMAEYDADQHAVIGTIQDITDRQQEQAARQQEHDRLASVIAGARLGTWEWNIQTNTTVFNAGWAEMLGYSLDELGHYSYATWEALVHPDDLAPAQNALRLCISGEQPAYEAEFRMRHKAGHWVWILDRGRVLSHDAAGKPLVMFGTHLDITAQKQREDRVALLGQMLDAAPAAITIHDTQGRFFFANRRAAAIHGYATTAELLDINLHVLDVPDSEALLQERFRQIDTAGEARFEVAHYRKDGSSFPLEVLAKAIPWNGAPAILSVATDITDRKQAEAALRDSERRIQSIFRSAPIGIGLAVNRVLKQANRYFCEMTGYTEAELLDQNSRMLYPSTDEYERVGRDKYAQIRNHGTGTVETRWQRKDGTVIDVLLSSTPIDLSDLAQGVTFTALDITRRKVLEEQLRQAQKMESIGRLAGGVAHDFNNMLAVILGNAEMVQEQLPAGEPLREDIQEIVAAARRSAAITKQLLAFARKQAIAPRLLDINTTIEGMLKMLRRLIGEDIRLDWRPGANLCRVLMDPSQIDQILANLCVNARDAITRGGTITMETSMVTCDAPDRQACPEALPGTFICLAVSDDGCGMDPQTLEQVFEPFFSTKAVNKGTGLGLATVYGIVTQNHGFITVTSTPGHGTAFKIFLPAAAATDTPAESQTPNAATLPTSHGETVLLVEDEVAILRMCRNLLNLLGYKVLATASATEALRLAETHGGPIDLLLTDVIMPEMDGCDLAARVKTLQPQVRTLFMSGYAADAIAHRGELDTSVCLLHKPFSREEIAHKIRDALTGGNPEPTGRR